MYTYLCLCTDMYVYMYIVVGMQVCLRVYTGVLVWGEYVYVGVLCIFTCVCMQVCEDVYVCVHTGVYCT